MVIAENLADQGTQCVQDGRVIIDTQNDSLSHVGISPNSVWRKELL
jgi:hypothetical protein